MRFAAPLLLGLCLVACNAENGDEGGDRQPEPAPVAQDQAALPASDSGEAAEAAAEAEATQKPLALSLDVDGLRLIIKETGSARPLPFGEPRARVETALGNAVTASPERSENGECPAGPMAFTDYGDLSLHFINDRFVGWSVSDASKLTTVDGIGLGTTRAKIADSRTISEQEDSTLGTELVIGEGDGAIVALMSGPGDNARVTHLWAGTSCVFR